MCWGSLLVFHALTVLPTAQAANHGSIMQDDDDDEEWESWSWWAADAAKTEPLDDDVDAAADTLRSIALEGCWARRERTPTQR